MSGMAPGVNGLQAARIRMPENKRIRMQARAIDSNLLNTLLGYARQRSYWFDLPLRDNGNNRKPFDGHHRCDEKSQPIKPVHHLFSIGIIYE
jgi:hypothetical protein